MKNLKEDYKERVTNCTPKDILHKYTVLRIGRRKEQNAMELEEKRDDALNKLYNRARIGDPQNRKIKFVL